MASPPASAPDRASRWPRPWPPTGGAAAARAAVCCGLAVLAGCAGRLEALYPSRPVPTPAPLVPDPAPARVVVHATVTSQAILKALERALPATGEAGFPLLGSERRVSWERRSLALGFQQGRLLVQGRVDAHVELPLSSVNVPVDVRVLAEPIVSSALRARLQSLEVEVSSSDLRLRVAQGVAGALDRIRGELERRLAAFELDLTPQVAAARERLERPIAFSLGEAQGCAQLKVLGLEAGPTVLADGVEKDLALLVAPAITLPCADPGPTGPLPPLANVAAVPTGPFTVTVPIAARYDELQRALALAFPGGRLRFSAEFPDLVLERPEIYASGDQLVLKMHLAGPLKRPGLRATLDGDLYMIGHPAVVDNELRVPDLEPTLDTTSFLLKLKAAIDGGSIRDQARAALRLDLGERLRAVRERLSTELGAQGEEGCLRAQVQRLEVTGVHPHAGYLRVYVAATGQAAVDVPCR